MGGQQSVPVIQLPHDLNEAAAEDNESRLSGAAPPKPPSDPAPPSGGAPPPTATCGATASSAATPTPAATRPTPEPTDQTATDPADPHSSENPLARELREYRLTKHVLGEGAFAKVRLATSLSTNHQVAVKIIKRKKLDSRAETLLQREVKHHEKLRHENIVRLHSWIQGKTKYYLVMEYCSGGDLLQCARASPPASMRTQLCAAHRRAACLRPSRVRRTPSPHPPLTRRRYVNRCGMLEDDLARRLFTDLLGGIAFCHALGIYHRDLKLENLMLSTADPETMQVKIADFGLSDLKVRVITSCMCAARRAL